jgi:hypothetical protein
MRQLTNLAIMLGAVGLFSSGFVFWMANSAHQEGERLRRHGEYCEVEVVRKERSPDADGGSMNYYVHVKPVNRTDTAEPIQCEVHYRTYEQLNVGQKLKAWVLGNEAALDIGPNNTASVARTMVVTCIGFAVLLITGLTLKVVYRTRRSSEPPPSLSL